MSVVPGLQRLITRAIQTYGETLTLLRASGTVSFQALTAPMDGATTGLYFDANEEVGLTKPALSVYVDGQMGSPPAPTDVFFRDGRQFTVQKVFCFRVGDVVVLILALCD